MWVDPEVYIVGTDRSGKEIIDNVSQTVAKLKAIGDDQALTEYAKLLRPYLPDDHATNKPKPSKERLSDCRDEWKEWQTLKKRTKVYVNATVNVFDEFIAFVGDLPCNQLSKSAFNRWKKHLMTIRNGQGPKWYNDHLRPLSAVLNHAKTETDFDLPDGLRDWIGFKHERYSPKKSNRQAMPADIFEALLKQCDQWAAIDVKEYAASLPVSEGRAAYLCENNNIKQAYRVKRRGYLWPAVLRLAANVGADNVDVSRLTFEYLKLTGPLPLFTLPRYKVREKIGESGRSSWLRS